MERLQKVIANYGYTSRRKAEELIVKGQVKVNDQVVTTLGIKVSSKDKIEVEGEVLTKEEKVYYLLNKPSGYLSTASDDRERKTVVDLIKTSFRIYPIGRLDYETTGLLLLTNDGELTNLLSHPSNKIKKIYLVKIKGILTKETILKLKTGVFIDNKKTAPAKVKIKKQDKKNDVSYVYLTIYEGRNRQVKKMFASLGYDVLKLKREVYAFLTLGKLQTKEYRKLTKQEVHELYQMVKK